MAAFQQIFRAIITAEAGGAVKEFGKYDQAVKGSSTAAVKELSKTEKAMGRVKLAAAAIGTTAAISLGKEAVDASRDLTESINAVNVMYGDSSAAVLQLSEDAARSSGLSKRAFNESAVAVGGFVTSIADIKGVDAAEVLDDLITRAADFGSVFNIDVDEALQRFRSGLAGETEPLRRFGINLLQSEVSAYALSEGLIAVFASLRLGRQASRRRLNRSMRLAPWSPTSSPRAWSITQSRFACTPRPSSLMSNWSRFQAPFMRTKAFSAPSSPRRAFGCSRTMFCGFRSSRNPDRPSATPSAWRLTFACRSRRM